MFFPENYHPIIRARAVVRHLSHLRKYWEFGSRKIRFAKMLKSRKISLKTAAILTRNWFSIFFSLFQWKYSQFGQWTKIGLHLYRDIAWPYCYWSAHGSWPIKTELAYTWNDVVEWNVKMGGAMNTQLLLSSANKIAAGRKCRIIRLKMKISVTIN